MTFTDLVNAIVGYYLIVLAVSAGMGVRETLRTPAAPGLATAGAASAPPPNPGAATPGSRAARISGLVTGRTLRAAHRFGWATGVGIALGWLTGADLYRAIHPRAASAAARLRERRTRGTGTPRAADPAAAQPPTTPAPDTAGRAPGGVPVPAATPPGHGIPPAVGPGSRWLDEHDDTPPDNGTPAEPARSALPAAPDGQPWPEDPRRPGRPLLIALPAPQEYPKIMPAAEITDLESLINFTGQVTDATGLEAEDAAAASASMIAGAEFAGETARRVADETTALEAAVAAMAMLRVDPESTAAYNALLEAGQIYRDTTATFSQQCHDAAFTAGQMSAAATYYNETARTALAVLNTHQMPHAEAATATGHSGAHGAFYGVADTGGQSTLPGGGAPQLPAS